MIRSAFTAMALLALMLFWVNPAISADVAKIGVIDIQRILENSSAGKKALAQINEQGKKMKQEIDQKGARLEEDQKKFEREAIVMNKDKRAEKEREIRIRINDFKTMQKKYSQEFKELEAKLVRKIRKDVYDLVGEVGKKEGYLLILEKHESGVVYMPNTVDITDHVIKLFNESATTKN